MHRLVERLGRPSGLALFAVAIAFLIVSRKPAVLLHAELWGDDGWTWYPDAYRAGWRCLAWPVNGYLNTLQRLGGLIVQPFPLAFVPTLFAGMGLAFQVAPAVFLLSPRMAEAWPDVRARAFIAAVYAVLPNEIELYANLTNAQWTLAILAFLVLVSAPPRSAWGTAFDNGVLLLSGLSGPFCLLLLPIAAWQAVTLRTPTARIRCFVLLGTAFVQLVSLLGASHGGRSTAPLGAGPRTLARIIALQILLGAETGYRGVADLPSRWPGNFWPVLVTVCGFGVAAVALLRGSALLRQWTCFAALTLAAALLRPQVSSSDAQWPIMAIPPMGNRYYTFSMLAWLAMLLTLAMGRGLAFRALGGCGLALLILWGIPRDWNEPRFQSTHFADRARAFATAPAGTQMMFPVVPPGLPPMVLTKRADGG